MNGEETQQLRVRSGQVARNEGDPVFYGHRGGARLYFLARSPQRPARAGHALLSPLPLLQPDWLGEKPGPEWPRPRETFS